MKRSYQKPYFWRYPYNYADRNLLIYKQNERLTDRFIFMKGINLPHENKEGLMLSQDPSTYDLILEANVPEETLRKFDHLPSTLGSVHLSKP